MSGMKSWSWEAFRRRFAVSIHGVDPVILVLSAGMVIFGLVMVYSSSFIFAQIFPISVSPSPLFRETTLL